MSRTPPRMFELWQIGISSFLGFEADEKLNIDQLVNQLSSKAPLSVENDESKEDKRVLPQLEHEPSDVAEGKPGLVKRSRSSPLENFSCTSGLQQR